MILPVCSDNNMNDDTAVKIYVESLIVEENYSTQPDSISYYQGEVFDKYKTTKEKYKTFIERLEFDQLRWTSFFNKADQYLIELRSNRAID